MEKLLYVRVNTYTREWSAMKDNVLLIAIATVILYEFLLTIYTIFSCASSVGTYPRGYQITLFVLSPVTTQCL